METRLAQLLGSAVADGKGSSAPLATFPALTIEQLAAGLLDGSIWSGAISGRKCGIALSNRNRAGARNCLKSAENGKKSALFNRKMR
jgi:hypothetical protein